MRPWFLWNNQNSDDMGLWISKLPKITRAKERYETVDIPGRAGSLTLLEGEDIYEPYVKECTVQTVNWNPRMEEILDWLRGNGELVFSNEIEYMYRGRIAGEVSFERIGNNLLQARIPFFVEPFKRSRYPDKDNIIVTDESALIVNVGNVASHPVVCITGSGSNVITIADQEMSFSGISGTIVVDCDAEIITKDDEIWTGTYSGDFWKIPVGTQYISQTGNMSIAVEPHWRWV